MADGQQWLSWIHRTDFIAIIDKLLESKVLQGIFNATAPGPVTNAEFSQTLGKVLNRPTLLPLPAFLLKILLGEMSILLIGGQRVIPTRIEQAEYEFQFKTLEQALMDVL